MGRKFCYPTFIGGERIGFAGQFEGGVLIVRCRSLNKVVSLLVINVDTQSVLYRHLMGTAALNANFCFNTPVTALLHCNIVESLTLMNKTFATNCSTLFEEASKVRLKP